MSETNGATVVRAGDVPAAIVDDANDDRQPQTVFDPQIAFEFDEFLQFMAAGMGQLDENTVGINRNMDTLRLASNLGRQAKQFGGKAALFYHPEKNIIGIRIGSAPRFKGSRTFAVARSKKKDGSRGDSATISIGSFLKYQEFADYFADALPEEGPLFFRAGFTQVSGEPGWLVVDLNHPVD